MLLMVVRLKGTRLRDDHNALKEGMTRIAATVLAWLEEWSMWKSSRSGVPGDDRTAQRVHLEPSGVDLQSLDSNRSQLVLQLCTACS